MKYAVAFSALLAIAGMCHSQEAYRCKSAGGYVIQDTPCKVSVVDRPAPVAGTQPQTAGNTQDRLAKDKEYLDKRAYERSRNESLDAIRYCEGDAYNIQAQIDYTAVAPTQKYVPDHVGLQAMQLEEERRQTALAGLQSRVTAKRHECSEMRRAHDAKYK